MDAYYYSRPELAEYLVADLTGQILLATRQTD